jgi:hypothetical protein
MTRFAIAAALALAVTLPAVTAQAQSPRTFVSAAGNDSNPCSFAAPCRHFQAAVNVTSDGGEVDALDPAGYSPITISRGITIEGQGWSYIAPPTGGAAITVNAVIGKVYIHGVSLNGAGITGNTTGIQFNSGSSLTVRDSVIRNFTQNGINFVPIGSTQVLVSNTLVSDNGANGVNISHTVSLSSTLGVLSRVELANNNFSGLNVSDSATGSGVDITFSDSVSTNNGIGISASVTGGIGIVNTMVRNSTIANNGGNGLQAGGGIGASIRATRSTIAGNGTAWANGTGQVTSYADNNIEDNGSGNTAPVQIGYK